MTLTHTPSSLIPTLPGPYYTDAAIFAAEQERIFEQMWFCAVAVRRPGQGRARSGPSRSAARAC